MKKQIWDYISTILIIINGIICIIYHEEMIGWLPSICAIVLLIKGTIKMIEGIKEKDYASLEEKKLELESKNLSQSCARFKELVSQFNSHGRRSGAHSRAPCLHRGRVDNDLRMRWPAARCSRALLPLGAASGRRRRAAGNRARGH